MHLVHVKRINFWPPTKSNKSQFYTQIHTISGVHIQLVENKWLPSFATRGTILPFKKNVPYAIYIHLVWWNANVTRSNQSETNKTKRNTKTRNRILILSFFSRHIFICIWKIATRNDIHKSSGQAIVFCAWYWRERVRERDKRREIEKEFKPKTTMKSLHDQLCD